MVGAIVIVSFTGFKYLSAAQTLNTDGSKVLQDWIASEYQRHHLARTELSDEQQAALLLQTSSISLASITARGKPESMAARVEIEPNAAHPPDMPYTRYFRLEYSIQTGWRHRGNIDAIRYHLTNLW